jgi:carbonic anhydrase
MQFFSSSVLKFLAVCSPFFGAVKADGASVKWDYRNQGRDWPDISPEFCKNGLN